MCLVLLAYRQHPDVPLVVAANRDEFYGRPAAPARFWDAAPELLAGQDLEAGGTWLGVTRGGRFAAVTNFAEPNPRAAPRSRGELTENFLTSDTSPAAYVEGLDLAAYRGFNLLLFANDELHYVSNRGPGLPEHGNRSHAIEPGIYGLANAEFGAQWPKVALGRDLLGHALPKITGAQGEAALLDLLADRRVPPDNELPASDRPLDQRRATAACFIAGQEYGTRASTCVLLGTKQIRFVEQRFGPAGEAEGIARFQWPHASV